MVQFLPGRLPPLTARGRNTNVLKISGAQPLLGLLQRVSIYRAQVSSSTRARWERAAVLADLRVELQATYLRLFEAQAMAETAILSERTLDRWALRRPLGRCRRPSVLARRVRGQLKSGLGWLRR